jgi:nicotinamide-nucleotide amidase
MMNGDVFDRLEVAARALGDMLKQRGLMLATAESCTGGLISAAITAVAGSSDWFERGFVTYSNQAKHDLLGVPMEVIVTHGAVSEDVARAMAAGAIAQSRAQVALSVTGIAGPSGGSQDKPVGLVWHGFAVQAGNMLRLEAIRQQYHGNRAQVREQAASFAIEHMGSALRSLADQQ